MNRKQEQAELLYKLGLLMCPLRDMVERYSDQNASQRAKACAKFTQDVHTFFRLLITFSQGETGHDYQAELQRVHRAISLLKISLAENRDNVTRLARSVESCKSKVISAILTIPTEVDSQIFEARSPFQAYCSLKAFCETTQARLIWADPYMGSELFHRYLNGLPAGAEITLVTSDRKGNRDFTAFMDVSRLFAAERGPSKYRLVTEQTFHDRYLRCDGELYHLGGSAKDAARKSDFTITKLPATPQNLKALDDLLSRGTEVFGPASPNHP